MEGLALKDETSSFNTLGSKAQTMFGSSAWKLKSLKTSQNFGGLSERTTLNLLTIGRSLIKSVFEQLANKMPEGVLASPPPLC